MFSLKFNSATIDGHVGFIMNLQVKLLNKNLVCSLKFRKIGTSYICILKILLKQKLKFLRDKTLNLNMQH